MRRCRKRKWIYEINKKGQQLDSKNIMKKGEKWREMELALNFEYCVLKISVLTAAGTDRRTLRLPAFCVTRPF